jgi:hypothetical protein
MDRSDWDGFAQSRGRFATEASIQPTVAARGRPYLTGYVAQVPPMGGRRSLAARLVWSAHIARRAPFEARFPFRAAAEIERAQIRRLRATIQHAHEHVPYYRETMRRLGLGPDEIRTVADLARLPLMDR